MGLLMAVVPDSLPFAWWIEHYEARFAPTTPKERHFFSAMLGGTILGYYVLATIVAAIPFRRRERWAWWTLTGGLLAWFVSDSAMSLMHGATFNVLMVNCPTLIAHGVPLALTARFFTNRRASME